MIARATSSQIEMTCEDRQLNDLKHRSFTMQGTPVVNFPANAVSGGVIMRGTCGIVGGILSQGSLLHTLAAATLSSESRPGSKNVVGRGIVSIIAF
jgi:hypothetical protein